MLVWVCALVCVLVCVMLRLTAEVRKGLNERGYI